MNKHFAGIILSFLNVLSLSQSSRILGVFPSPSKSHLIIDAFVAETLAAAGHNVTIIGVFPNPLPKAKYNFIQIEAYEIDSRFAQDLIDKPAPFHQKFKNLLKVILTTANNTMQHPKIKEFLSTHKAGDFDALILGYFMNDFMLGLGAHFQCPVIVSFMVRPIFAINSVMGNPELPSYVPNLFGNFKQPMDFGERVKNYLATFIENKIMATYMKWKMQEMYR